MRGREGELVVTPGAMVTLQCVFLRQRGNPEWTWETRGNGASRDVVTGWSSTDQDWHYSVELSNVSSEVLPLIAMYRIEFIFQFTM